MRDLHEHDRCGDDNNSDAVHGVFVSISMDRFGRKRFRVGQYCKQLPVRMRMQYSVNSRYGYLRGSGNTVLSNHRTADNDDYNDHNNNNNHDDNHNNDDHHDNNYHDNDTSTMRDRELCLSLN